MSKNIFTFFKKRLDKRKRLWYNLCVIRRQQVPVKAYSFPAEEKIESLFCVFNLSSRRPVCAGRKIFLFANFNSGGENRNAKQFHSRSEAAARS